MGNVKLATSRYLQTIYYDFELPADTKDKLAKTAHTEGINHFFKEDDGKCELEDTIMAVIEREVRVLLQEVGHIEGVGAHIEDGELVYAYGDKSTSKHRKLIVVLAQLHHLVFKDKDFFHQFHNPPRGLIKVHHLRLPQLRQPGAFSECHRELV